MWIAIGVIAAFLLFAICWIIGERAWDRRQFHQSGENDFVENIRADRARELLDNQPVILPVDVRTESRFSSSHLPGAAHCPYKLGSGQLDSSGLEEVPRESPLLVYCDGGYQSRKAIRHLRDKGFKRIYHLHRGMMSWKLNGGPTDKDNEQRK